MGLFTKSSHVSCSSSRTTIPTHNNKEGNSKRASSGGNRSRRSRSRDPLESYRKMGADDLDMDQFTLPAQYRTRKSKSPSQREGRSSVPRTIRTAIIASGSRSEEPSMRQSRSVDMGLSVRSPEPSIRGSRSVTPSLRESRSVDMGTSSRHHRGTSSRHLRSQSAEPGDTIRSSRSVDMGTSSRQLRSQSAEPGDTIRSSRSVDPSTTTPVKSNTRSRSAEPVLRADNRSTRESRSCSPSRNESQSEVRSNGDDHSSRKSRSRSSERRHETSSRLRISDAVPFRLNKDMTVLANGMNLDQNARNLLAAYDSKTLEDFYLMTDSDYSSLVNRAKARKHPLPPLQIRKIQMLRRWMREIVDDNIYEHEETNNRSLRSRKRNVDLVPKDWKAQYKNDLPHLKLQLREQGDSIFERIKNLSESFTCGAGIMY